MSAAGADLWPHSNSEMGQRIRRHDWSATKLGPPRRWPATLRVLLDTVLEAPLPMCILWGEQALQLYNDAHAALIGSRHPTELGQPACNRWGATWKLLAPACDTARRGEARVLHNQQLALERDGVLVEAWFNLALSPIRDDRQGIGGLLLCLSETSERVRTEARLAQAALRNSEAELKIITDALPVLIAYIDSQERFRFHNRACREWLGQAWLVGRELREVFGEQTYADRAQSIRTALAGRPVTFEARKDARHMLVQYLPRRDEHGVVQGFFVLAQDISERRQAERALRELNETLESRVQERTEALAQVYERLLKEMATREQTQAALRQAQKMEAVGQLTGGIAHDFNNMLTGIIGGLDLTQRYIQSGRHDETQRFIEAATTSANRAAALTHRLLAFARRQPLNLKRVELNELIDSMRDLLSRTLGSHICIETALQTGLWAVNSDENQLESALLNLMINARDAMPDGGVLRIATANVALQHQGEIGELAAGHYVTLSVADSGCGMNAKVLASVFEPFFTTKPIGQGTGLGLSMIYGFTRQAGGHVQITSEPGKGTEVRLYLPAHQQQAHADATAGDADGALQAQQGETVLVVEDDPAVRLLVLDVLEMLGYRALEAADGNRAEEVLETGAHLDLLITDVGLPGMNGRQLADIARQRRPGLRVLFMTGYAEQAASSGFLDPGMDMISKPFNLDDLAKRVRDMLAADRQ